MRPMTDARVGMNSSTLINVELDSSPTNSLQHPSLHTIIHHICRAKLNIHSLYRNPQNCQEAFMNLMEYSNKIQSAEKQMFNKPTTMSGTQIHYPPILLLQSTTRKESRCSPDTQQSLIQLLPVANFPASHHNFISSCPSRRGLLCCCSFQGQLGRRFEFPFIFKLNPRKCPRWHHPSLFR